MRQLSGKLFRQRRDHDHVLSKRIVQNTAPGATIVLENLTCGYQLNADLNAAQNIREKYRASLASLGTSLAGGLPVKQPIVSDIRV